MEPDFSGWATKAGLKCTDGRVITPEAFKHQDKVRVPLVWHHGGQDKPENILGHADLEHREGEGVYAYCYFNDTPSGKNSKELVQHGDIRHLSILANNLVEKLVSGTKQVLHGMIREVSLVMAGANPGAEIDFVAIQHGDGTEEVLSDTAVIHTGLAIENEAPGSNEGDGPTMQDVYDAMSEDEKSVVHYIVNEALAAKNSTAAHSATDDTKPEGDKKPEDDKKPEGDKDPKGSTTDDKSKDEKPEGELAHQEGNNTLMHQNVFEMNGKTIAGKDGKALTHDQLTSFAHSVFEDYKKPGMTFKDAMLAHADEYGIQDIELLFPNFQNVSAEPQWITRRMVWVEVVMGGTRKLPFSRIRSLAADLTFETARAKGYIKASLKKEQFFKVAKRETSPKTIYKKQKLDRDDIVDITDFDVVGWLWIEMNFMLREEAARAILIGDGREIDDEDKIDEDKIRPIALDDPFYADVVTVPLSVGGNDLVEAVLRARYQYRGTGQPAAFMTNAVMTDMLLAKDKMGRRYFNSKVELATGLNVSSINEVPVMEGVQRDGGEVLIILVNLTDYAVGSTRGGEITRFDFFDIDHNQNKYLIEGRFSGALTNFKTAQVFVRASGGTEVTPDVPTFNPATGVVTIPNTANVVYKNQDTDATLNAGAQNAIAQGVTISVVAVPADGFYFPHNFDADWDFTRPNA